MSARVEAKGKISFWKIFFRFLPVMYKASSWMFIGLCISGICLGLSFGVITLINQQLFDSATYLAMGETTIGVVLFILGILMFAQCLSQLFNGIVNFLWGTSFMVCERETSKMLQRKLAKISPEHFECTKDLDNLRKAVDGSKSLITLVSVPLMIGLMYLPYVLFMGGYLYKIKPSLVLMIVIIFIPTILTQVVRTKVFAKLEDESAPIKRENDYYEKCIVEREYFKETRLLGGYTYFMKLFKETLEVANQLKFKAELKTNMIELGMKLLGVIGYAGVLLMLVNALMNGEITIGMFAAIYGSVGMMQLLIEEVVYMHIGGISKELGAVNNFVKVLDYPEREGEEVELDRGQQIVVENLSYKYDGADEYSLQDISFTLNPGETLAIVGENGCGKSTLIKLITGMYKPTKGRVKIGEYDMSEISMKSLFSNVSTVFQKYQRYQMTLRENIEMSMAGKEMAASSLDEVCQIAGFNPEEKVFENGYETMLSREFGGVDLSGGWWQKVAIARGYCKPHNFIILDEPTAAIDPIEETKLYNRFARISKDKTSIIVTHRLGSAKLADRILMLEKGKLIECGTHEELMNNNGKYAKMYNSQSEWYD